MTNFAGAKLKEKSLMKRVEKAVFDKLGQPNFFITDIAVVDEDTIRQYNRETRGIDAVTDVLSFPYFDKLHLPVCEDEFLDSDRVKGRVCLGSIMICRKRAEEQAREYGHSIEREMGFLTCHGFLHILGFDHVVPEDEKVMFPLQEEIMSSIGLERK
ncbi:MAG: rRNA maturation RNase YbeY [Clostridia bacterium]|nr:rRNA maturation RNase YbeY [Clostridia bacterium]